MVFVLIPAAWLAVVFLALTMFRLAALSDDLDDIALAERIAAGRLADRKAAAARVLPTQLGLDRERRVYRRTG